MSQRTLIDVLPSGVEFEVRNLRGSDQEDLTRAKTLRDGSGFATMLASALLRLGDNTNVTVNDVDRMLSNDRKYALIALRQHTLRYQKFFNFSYEWPLRAGQTAKELEQHSVEFTEESFPKIPYLWVRERIALLKSEALEKQELYDGSKYPVIYTNYGEMLAVHKEQNFTLQESGLTIRWSLLTGEQENKFGKIDPEVVHSNTMLTMREPKIVLQNQVEKKETLTGWNHSAADLLDVEDFRTEIRNVEGSINSTITIQNKKDSSRTARVELLATTDFFFPSQAI